MRLVRALAVVAALSGAVADDDDVTRWDFKAGFIPGTKDDVEAGFMTIDAAKNRCAQLADCLAITFRAPADSVEPVYAYLKRDSTVAETDKTWSSLVKRPAGLMDVNYINQLAFPLELCWIDLIGTAAPVCYGTVQPGSSKNMTSFASHNFVLKRLVWSLTAGSAALSVGGSEARLAAALGGGAPRESKVAITARQRALEWEAPLTRHAAAPPAPDAAKLPPIKLVNQLPQPAEVCSAPLWASRLLQSSMPAGLETCHGVAAAGGGLTVPALDADSLIFARQLVGVTTIQK